jgi:hypothetical protein
MSSDPILVPLWVLAVIQARLAKLVKVAQRLGVAAPSLVVSEPVLGPVPVRFLTAREADWYEISGERPEAMLVTVVQVGASPVLPGGWSVLASVDHDPAGNLVACSPEGEGLGLAAALLHAEPTCDHCGLDRNRLRTIVLRATDGRTVRVGSTCLRSFLGYHGDSLDAIWSVMAGIDTDIDPDTDEARTARGNYGDPLHGIAAAAFAAVRTFGFTKSQPDDYRATPTRERVSTYLYGTATQRADAGFTVTEADNAAATEAIAWLLHNTDTSDYLTNLRTLALRDAVTYKHLGLAVSIPQARKSAAQREAEQAAREARKAIPAGPVPTGKVTVEGLVVNTAVKHNDYGTRYVMTVMLDNGARVWGTIPSKLDVYEGDRVRFSALVEASDKPDFGFYKRPTKAQVITEAAAG